MSLANRSPHVSMRLERLTVKMGAPPATSGTVDAMRKKALRYGW
jgi:hypothetical protein